MKDESTQSASESMTMTLSEIREIVDNDKSLGIDVLQEARSAIGSLRGFQLTPDITGKPDGLEQFNRFKGDQQRNLEAVTRSPFFSRFRAVMSDGRESEEIAVLITEARDVGGAVFGDGWLLTNWTSPLGIAIRGVTPGEQVSVEVHRMITYDVDSLSTYENLLPAVKNGEFEVVGRRGVIATEDELTEIETTSEAATELAPVEYEAKATFGLNDIVVLVDKPQQAALGLPFEQSVVIDGPPGSGKTSVGIMRIAVLYDQQWEKLGLDRMSDKPFHDNSTMRILVYNEEMVEYLRNLALSIGVSHVQVMTTKDFFKKICRATRMMSGTDRRDSPSLSILKSRRESLLAYFAGFKVHIAAYWEEIEDDLRQQLFDIGPDFLALADRLNGWVGRVGRASVKDDRIVGSIGIADGLTDVAEAIKSGRSPTRRSTSPVKDVSKGGAGNSPLLDVSKVTERMLDVRKIVDDAVRSMCGRAGITKAMFDQPEYETLKLALVADGVTQRTIEDGDRLWRKQYQGDRPAYSEPDLAMSAWLGASLLLSITPRRKPWIGGQPDRLTHLVVDEAQDLSPSHLVVLASQLVNNGTMTLVGDIHQNLNPHAGLKRWEDTGLPATAMRSFGVNHRQTRQLGEFVGGLYSGLFAKDCRWEPSAKLVGSLPRAGVARSWKQLTVAIAAEVRFWRAKIGGVNGATVAVLYDGKMESKKLHLLQERLEIALSDELISVEATLPGSGGEALRRTDRVVIASVKQTKGLEFDAVIFVEPRPRWSKSEEEIDLRWRNGFYVATSRARAGLSICMSNLPLCVEPLIEKELCTRIEWNEQDIVELEGIEEDDVMEYEDDEEAEDELAY